MSRWCILLARLIPVLWLGAGLAISLIAIPVVFSPTIKSALPAPEVGHVAQSILGRFFGVQLGLLAIGLTARWCAGWNWTRLERLMWAILAVGALLAGFWMHPKLRELHRIKYDPAQPLPIQERASNEFRQWHGISQVGNLLMLFLLASVSVQNFQRPAR